MSLKKASNLLASSQSGVRGGQRVLWEWNGADITQFGDGAGNGDSSYGSPDGTLSVGATPGSGIDVPSGNALIYTTGSATNAIEYYKINDLPPLPERFIFRARLGPETSNCKAIMCFGQDATHHMAFCWAVSQSTYQLANNNSGVWEAGLYLRTGGPGTVQSGAVFEIDAMLRHPDTGVDPQICLDVRGPGVSATGYGKGGETWTAWGGSGAAYDSSWQSGGDLTPAISFALGAAATAVWISEMQILSHPWTKEA